MSEGGYIQGAGDDSEGWAHGLTPPVFWANRAILKQTPEEDLPDVISELVKEYQQRSAGQAATLVSPTHNLFISQTDALVNESGQYDLIINCNGSPTAADGNEKRLNLGCASAKLGSRDLRQVLDKVREFVSAQLEVDPSRSLLVTCDTGKDLSVGALLAIICLFYKDDGNVLCPQKSLDKFRRSMKRGIKKKTRLTLIVQEPSMSRRARTQSASSSSDSVSRGSFRPNTT
jgi:tRNA A64-2'-O-ribosylphosphate transferase